MTCYHTEWIYYTSWLSIMSLWYALARGHGDLAIVPACVLFTSVNFWRDPKPGVRRVIDYACVNTALGYQVVRSIRHGVLRVYIIPVSCAGASFLVSLCAFHAGQCGLFLAAHVLLHILGNISNIVLYRAIDRVIRSSVGYQE